MSKPLMTKMHSERGIARIIVIMLILVIILSITSLIPSYKKYQEQGKTLACATALDTARRQLASNFMLNGFENGSAEEAKKYIAYVMNGWDDLCPDHGNVYIVPKGEGLLDWDVVCGLHCADKKLCTRLNASHVLDELREALLRTQNEGNLYPESLPFTLHGKEYTAYLVDEPTGLKRGTRTTPGYEKMGIVAYYSLIGHSDFGSDCGLEGDGKLWYFSFADELHCANWDYHNSWTGDSYRGV